MQGAAISQTQLGPTASTSSAQATPSFQMAPSFRLVGLYLGTGITAFLALCLLLALYSADLQGAFFQGRILALTHLTVLGWVSMVIFGALFQMVPVVFETRLHSEKLAFLQYALFLPGLLGMVVSFWNFKLGDNLLVSAALTAAAFFLFIVNVGTTLIRSQARSLSGLFIATGLFYLSLTATLGFLLALNLTHPYIVRRDHLDLLKIHAHWGMAGWVGMIIMGVALKLIPMFSLAHGFQTKPAKWAYGLFNTGLLTLALGWWTGPQGWAVKTGGALLACGATCFLYQIKLIHGARLRRTPDLGMRYSLLAFSLVAVAAGLGLGLIFFNFQDGLRDGAVLTYVSVVLLGAFSLLIMGQLYKIVPFLVWFHTFSSQVGLKPVPLLKDLYDEKIGSRQFWLMSLSLPFLWVGIFFNRESLRLTGALGLALSTVLFGWNMVHLFRWRFTHGER